MLDIKKPRVGVVGEILVKFHPTANNDLVNLLEREGAEAVVPDLLTFALYCCHNQVQKEKYLGGSRKGAHCRESGGEGYRMVSEAYDGCSGKEQTL